MTDARSVVCASQRRRGPKARIGGEVAALGRELKALADVSESERVDYRRYEALKSELQRRGFFLRNDHAQDIANAFHAQGAGTRSAEP